MDSYRLGSDLIPIAARYRKILKSMTKQYCTGKSKDRMLGPVDSGVKTCKKARSVFYATMHSKGIDYTEVREEDLKKIEETVNWYLEEVLQSQNVPGGLKPTQVYGGKKKGNSCRERLIARYGEKKGKSLYQRHGEDACKTLLQMETVRGK